MLQVAENNLHATFPGLQIVGRYVGYYPKTAEKNVIEAIYKASPSLVLFCDGIREKDVWAYHRRNQFSSSVFLYYHDAIGIFSERINRVSERSFDRGCEIWFEIMHNPFKIFLIFPYMWYNILLVWYRIRKK
jgi:N-acetylglucosaminyldiphosphoundecaprenol N-acetyl-beta-D-mannosaminyltransferase